jgi:hypothetical protein
VSRCRVRIDPLGFFGKMRATSWRATRTTRPVLLSVRELCSTADGEKMLELFVLDALGSALLVGALLLLLLLIVNLLGFF